MPPSCLFTAVYNVICRSGRPPKKEVIDFTYLTGPCSLAVSSLGLFTCVIRFFFSWRPHECFSCCRQFHCAAHIQLFSSFVVTVIKSNQSFSALQPGHFHSGDLSLCWGYLYLTWVFLLYCYFILPVCYVMLANIVLHLNYFYLKT